VLIKAVEALLSVLRIDPETGTEPSSTRKAKTICNFAENISDQILLRSGFERRVDNKWIANQLVEVFDASDSREGYPGDYIQEMYLYRISSSLTSSNTDRGNGEHLLIFGNERALEWNPKTDKPHQIMTYEEAARFVIFWLAEKILQIIRKNHWDRVSTLPSLYDRLSSLLLESPQKSHIFVLSRVYSDSWDTRGYVTASSIEEAAKKLASDFEIEDRAEDEIIWFLPNRRFVLHKIKEIQGLPES
jgi:hypothetical protein